MVKLLKISKLSPKYHNVKTLNSMNSKIYFNAQKDGETLLHRLVKSLLAEKYKIRLIFRLCDAGVDVNRQNSDQLKTCLHFAVIEGYPEVVYCLLQNGADLTLVDNVSNIFEIIFLNK